MSSFFESGPLPDWKDVQKWLGKDIPWNLVDSWDRKDDANWINEYVKKLIAQAKPTVDARESGLVRFETKQDAKTVLLRLNLSPDIDLKRLQLFAASDRLKLCGLPGDKTRVIRFPCLVYPRSGKAAMKKDGRIDVRFKRRPRERSEFELFIQP